MKYKTAPTTLIILVIIINDNAFLLSEIAAHCRSVLKYEKGMLGIAQFYFDTFFDTGKLQNPCT